LDQLRARSEPELFLLAADNLCEFAQIDKSELGLPDAVTLADRASQGQGFTRPELSVLLGLAKLHAQALLHGDGMVDDGYLDPLYRGYFPERFQAELPGALGDHRLRREITALRVVNRLVDAGGATLFDSLCTELAVGVPQAAAAMIQAEDLLRAQEIRAQLLDGVDASREGIYQALIELDEGVRVVARFLVKRAACELDSGRVLRWRTGLDVLSDALEDYLSEPESLRLQARRERLRAQGLSRDLVDSIAVLPLADRGLNVIGLTEGVDVAPIQAAKAYARLGEETGINWVYGRLGQAATTSMWDRVALVDIRWELLDLQRHITSRVLQAGADDLSAAVSRFVAEHEEDIRRVRELQRDAAISAPATALTVIVARLRGLRADD
jgi:glutamate dehydrogenase